MKKLPVCFLIVLLAFADALQAQVNRPEINLEDFAERLFQVQSQDISYEDLYESLLLYYSSPINLNNTTREELASLYILSPVQLTAFFEHLEKNGKLLNLYELQTIRDFDQVAVRNLLPFVTVTENLASGKPLLTRILEEENTYLILRYSQILETQRGYEPDNENGYRGSQGRYYGRFRTSHTWDFSIGFTFEKDPGEAWTLDKNATGFDFYSYHLQLYNKGRFRTLALGDYQLQFGQGLVFGAGFNPGKGAETIATVKRSSLGVRPYASVLESGFFRGAAATYQLTDKLNVTGFYSRLNQDANPQNDTTFTDFLEFVNSVQSTGLHRTPGELSARNRITEQNMGANLTYDYKALEVGTNFLYTRYSLPLFRRPNNYNQFEFRGDRNYVGSVYANYNWQNFILFSEMAVSRSGGRGFVGGFAASLSSNLDMSMVFRNYARDFHSLYGNSFGESSRNINERGIYWGLKYKPSRRYFFTAYFDRFSFPWLRFRTEAPSDGYEFLLRANYAPTRRILLYAQWRQEADQLTVSDSGAGNLNRLRDTRKDNFLVNADFKVNNLLMLRSKVQWSTFLLDGQLTNGIAVVQDVNLTFRKWRFSGRLALFDTDDFENRQYVFERNVLYAFSIPAYNGQGLRSYLLVRYKPTKKVNLEARYARFQFRDRDTVGSGNESSQGNTRSEVVLQMRFSF